MRMIPSVWRVCGLLVAGGALAGPACAMAQSLPELAQRLAVSHPRLQSLRAEASAAQRDVERVKASNGLHVSTFTDAGGHSSNAPSTSAGDMGVRARYPVYDWGKADEEAAQSEAKLSAANAHLDAETYTMWIQLSEVYINVLRQKSAADIAQQNVERLRALQRQVREIAAVDPGRAIDLRQVESRLTQAELQMMDRRTQQKDAEVQLMEMLKLPAVQTEPLEDIDALIPADYQNVLTRLDAHPSQKESGYAIDEARHAMRMQAALEKPHFDLQATLSSRDLYERFKPFGVRDIRIMVDWDAFDGGSAKAATAVSADRLRSAQEQAASTHMDLQSDVSRSYAKRRDIAQRIEMWGRQISTSIRLSDEFWQQFRVGRRTILDLLTATGDIYQAQLNASNDQYELLQTDYRLFIQLGLAKAKWDQIQQN